MSTSSTQSRGLNRRINSLQSNNARVRDGSGPRKRVISPNDAYMFALRVAFLAYLLQPRQKRVQHVPAQQTQIQRASISINDLMKDFTLIRDSKSTRFPHGFMSELEKRLTGVLVGKERRPEYNDAAIKRTFAAFFNAFTEQSFKKRMEKDRRVEDLVLIFFSNATKELQKGRPHGDDGWKLMVDRHLALFVRLVSLVLKDHDWVRDRPELTNRLATLESKLLAHDQDLAAASSRNGGVGGSTIEITVPLSFEVKDMPLVQVVARSFGLRVSQVQSDINKFKSVWTERAALSDLKTYQTYLNLNSKKTLRREDFDLDDAYDVWRKTENQDLSQMILSIMQTNPDLSKDASGPALPNVNHHTNTPDVHDSGYPESLKRRSDETEASSYIVDQPFDMGSYNSSTDGSEPPSEEEQMFTFIPPDPRGFFRFIINQLLSHDLKDPASGASDGNEVPIRKLLSKQSLDLLNEISMRWRIPSVSKMVLFLDVVREKFIDQEIDLDILDAAFLFSKEGFPESKRSPHPPSPTLAVDDRNKWIVADTALYQQILSKVQEALLRDLYDAMQHCYDKKPPNVGPLLYVLESYVQSDPSCTKSSEDLEIFSKQLHDSLQQKAHELYRDLLEKEVPQDQSAWEFLHVIQLGKAVLALASRIQKRYRKHADILGVNPLNALVETILPLYAEDARDIVVRILQLADEKGEEIPVEDGFNLYGELTEVRRKHAEILPELPFAFHIEEQLANFVWRWIRMTEATIKDWVDQAVKQDAFEVRAEKGQIPSEDQRHSVSVIDIFSSFNQIIDRIVQLQWDHDLQYAKFMTQLAKIVGIGIARYCEVLEQRFTKEMDRLTPEQEAASNQSTQEKWMKLAKETWNNKEKIEPFQFFPQSFVKLNNIDFAAHQLDTMERVVNVDECVRVIQAHAPPVMQRQRKINNYVFTIKIVEAENLKACDINGSSDPYVVLGDEYQKRLAKTRIIYRNLNPRWDETVDITTQGPLNIIATIWDWDAMGDHDCVGRTSLKLDPSHFGDFLPREYWLDLDSQGRILLRVSMEGERDDIQFYFAKAFRTLKRTERDMTRKITDKVSEHSILHLVI